MTANIRKPDVKWCMTPQPLFAQICRLPLPFCRRHTREHHISPHFGQHGKFEPCFPQVAHAVWTENMDVRSRLSSTGCSSDLRANGSVAAVCVGVVGPAEDGAVGKYSDPESDEGVRHIEGIVVAGDSTGDEADLRSSELRRSRRPVAT